MLLSDAWLSGAAPSRYASSVLKFFAKTLADPGRQVESAFQSDRAKRDGLAEALTQCRTRQSGPRTGSRPNSTPRPDSRNRSFAPRKATWLLPIDNIPRRADEEAARDLARCRHQRRRLLDVGSMAAAAQAGALFGFQLIWAVVLGTICMIFLVEMAGRFAAIIHHTIADGIRERFGFNAFIWPLIATLLVNFLVLSAEIGGVALLSSWVVHQFEILKRGSTSAQSSPARRTERVRTR
ncbi:MULTISPECIES: divalent metal cation transporter [unclassified Mesorhizobium]|uniref:divalent metal cation transporter n=1 Tax=unclassified Mesorhizobium TaxID=325217 RepID=UPI001FEFBAE1|nr:MULTISPECIES: divalent metal cation transporter [unclassified Mesorhizobium]